MFLFCFVLVTSLLGHNYTGPYNPLDQLLSYDPENAQIREILQQPTNATDAVAMQHDVDYGSCSFRKEKYGEDEKSTRSLLTASWSRLSTRSRGKSGNGDTRLPGTR